MIARVRQRWLEAVRRMSAIGTPRTHRSPSGESDHWFSADAARCVPPDSARLHWAPTESDFPQAAVMLLSRVEHAERPVDTIYRSGLLGATQACTAVFEKHLPLRPVHADGIAAVPVQRGLAHLIKDAHADGRRLRHLNDCAGVPFIEKVDERAARGVPLLADLPTRCQCALADLMIV